MPLTVNFINSKRYFDERGIPIDEEATEKRGLSYL
jgi:hypothetical protein